MIRIAVIGANGQAGRHIVAEALARGFEVTAFVRGMLHRSGGTACGS